MLGRLLHFILRLICEWRGHDEQRCAWALLITGLLACALFFLTIVSHPTPEERGRVYDSMGKTTGVNWR